MSKQNNDEAAADDLQLDAFFDEVEEQVVAATVTTIVDDGPPETVASHNDDDDDVDDTLHPPMKKAKISPVRMIAPPPPQPRGVVVASAAAAAAVVPTLSTTPATTINTNNNNNYHYSNSNTVPNTSYATIPPPPPTTTTSTTTMMGSFVPSLPHTNADHPSTANISTAAGTLHTNSNSNSSNSTNNNKNKPHIRTVAGKVWVDPSLSDWPDNDYRIFVGNLDPTVTDQQLYQHFHTHYPSLNQVRIIRDKKKNDTSLGYGFVSLLDPLECARAIREQDQSWLGGRPIRIKRSHWKDRELQGKQQQQQKLHLQQPQSNKQYKKRR